MVKVANRCTITRCGLGTSRSEIDFPSWFPSTADSGRDLLNTQAQPRHVMCNNGVMVSLLKMETRKLADISGDFYAAIFHKGRDCQLVNGRMTYAALTPPWLRAPVVFLYVPNDNISIPFAMQELSRKNIIREKGKKLLVARFSQQGSQERIVAPTTWYHCYGNNRLFYLPISELKAKIILWICQPTQCPNNEETISPNPCSE